MKKALSVILCISILFCSLLLTAASQEQTDYYINNPYSSVNFNTYNQYKTDLHCHSLVSDGGNQPAEMIERHYQLGYDIMALTDHGTVDRGWVDVNTVPVISLIGKVKADDLSLTVQGLTQERFNVISSGSDRNSRGMLRVPFGIENNPTSFNNTHVNSWFVDVNNANLGGTSDYEGVIKAVQQAGGLCVINHPGEYTSAKKESDPELAYNSDYSYYLNKFTSLLLKYDACIGIDINSKGDSRTKNDRKLWDILLQNCIPHDRTVLAIATSDAHNLNIVDSGFSVMCMPENTVEALRNCMESGAFFAGSRYIKNSKELSAFAEETGLALSGDWEANKELDPPKITNIVVDNAEDTITLSAQASRTIHWIADGEVIATGASIDLNDYEDKIGSYVRAEVFGDGGILYTQAFTLEYDGAPQAKDFSGFFDFGVLVSLLKNGILVLCNAIPFFPLLWKVLTGKFFQWSKA